MKEMKNNRIATEIFLENFVQNRRNMHVDGCHLVHIVIDISHKIIMNFESID